MQDLEGSQVLGRRVLVTGLSEREYMSRIAPGPVLPFPHSPLPFPLSFPCPLDPFAYDPLFCADEDIMITKSSCFTCLDSFPSSNHISSIVCWTGISYVESISMFILWKPFHRVTPRS